MKEFGGFLNFIETQTNTEPCDIQKSWLGD
jgi:hypothetical protein